MAKGKVISWTLGFGLSLLLGAGIYFWLSKRPSTFSTPMVNPSDSTVVAAQGASTPLEVEENESIFEEKFMAAIAAIPSRGLVFRADENEDIELSSGGLTNRPLANNLATTNQAHPNPFVSVSSEGGEAGPSGENPGAVAPPISPVAPVAPHVPIPNAPANSPPNGQGDGESDGGIVEVLPVLKPSNGEPIVSIEVRENLIPTLVQLNPGEGISLNFLPIARVGLSGGEPGQGVIGVQLGVEGNNLVIAHPEQVAILDGSILNEDSDSNSEAPISLKVLVNSEDQSLEVKIPEVLHDLFNVQLQISGNSSAGSFDLLPEESLLHVNLPLL